MNSYSNKHQEGKNFMNIQFTLRKSLPLIISLFTLFQGKVFALCGADSVQFETAENTLEKNKNTVTFNKIEFEMFSILWFSNQLSIVYNSDIKKFAVLHTPYSGISNGISKEQVYDKIITELGCTQNIDGIVDSEFFKKSNKDQLNETNDINKKLSLLYQLSILYAQEAYENIKNKKSGEFVMTQISGEEQDIAAFYTYANQLRGIINSNPDYTKKYQIILQTLKMFEVRLMGKSYNGIILGNPVSASRHHSELAPVFLNASTEGLPIIKQWLQESKQSLKTTGSKDTLNGYIMRMEPYIEGLKSGYYRLNNDPRFTSSVPAFYQTAEDVIGIMLDIFEIYKVRNDDTEERNYVRLLQLFLEILPDHMEATINGYGSSQYFDQKTLNFAAEAKQYLLQNFKKMDSSGKYYINDQVKASVVEYATTIKSDQIASRASQLGINEFSNAIDRKMLAVIARKDWTPKDYHELELAIDGSNATTLPGAKHNFDQALSQVLPDKLGIHSTLVSQTTPYKRYSTEYGKDMWVCARQYKISGYAPWQGKMVLHFDLTAKLYGSHVNKFTTIIRPNQVMSPITFESIEMRERPEDFSMSIPESRYTMSNIQVTPN